MQLESYHFWEMSIGKMKHISNCRNHFQTVVMCEKVSIVTADDLEPLGIRIPPNAPNIDNTTHIQSTTAQQGMDKTERMLLTMRKWTPYPLASYTVHYMLLVYWIMSHLPV